MLIIGLVIGFGLGLVFWLYQQVQLSRYLGLLPRLAVRWIDSNELPLIPRLQYEIRAAKRKQEFLQKQLHICQNILEVAPIGYLQVDEENQLLFCNQQAREMLYLQKWHPGNLRLLLEVVRSYELDNLIEKTRYLQKQQVKEWIFYPACEDANAILQTKSQALRATSIPLPAGKVAVFLEDTQPLLDMTKARDRTFSDLSHELKTPLTSIRLVVETLEERVETPWKRLITRLLQEVDRLIGLVKSSLELNHLETEIALQLNYQSIELCSLAFHVWEYLEPIAQKKDVKLLHSGLDSLWIEADPARMHQVFLNLLDNAIKHSLPHTDISLELQVITTDQAGYQIAEINIIDSGTGFALADLPHIFERFYRGDESRSRSPSKDIDSTSKSDGSGLGLAIVKQIIQAHNGTIKAMNHPQTGGAWVQIQLPKVIDN
ncbi:MAG: PAS domain-containing sensor histidine kinase [Cyanobacteria bacterium P01_A01_bin.84]